MERNEIALRRLVNQSLTKPAFSTAQAVVENLGAVQSQDYAGAKWALALRMTTAPTDSELDKAFDAGTILRTHILRPTWHFVTPDDIRWMLELTAPRVHAANAHMYRQLAMDEGLRKKSNAILVKALQGNKYKTRAELGAALQAHGIETKDGMRLGYTVHRAELDALICSGPRRGKQFTYALLEERAPNAKRLPREEALYELARRYFTTRGPATPADFSMWSGLTVTDAKKAAEMLKSELVSAAIDGHTYWFPPTKPPTKPKTPGVYFLPNYDEFFIGFKDRSAFGTRIAHVTDKVLERALFVHIIVIDGQIVAGWRRDLKKDAALVQMNILADLAPAEEKAIALAAEKYGEFLGLDVELMRGWFK